MDYRAYIKEHPDEYEGVRYYKQKSKEIEAKIDRYWEEQIRKVDECRRILDEE